MELLRFLSPERWPFLRRASEFTTLVKRNPAGRKRYALRVTDNGVAVFDRKRRKLIGIKNPRNGACDELSECEARAIVSALNINENKNGGCYDRREMLSGEPAQV